MTVNAKVREYLEKNNVDYEVVSHPKVFSSIEEARALGIEADEIAKCLVVHMQDERALVVIPGGRRISNKKVREAVGNKHARLATEDEMRMEFPDWELGAVPPLGELFDMPIYLDRSLIGHETILFTAGSHTESIKINTADFVNLIKPDIVDLCEEERWAA